MRTWGVKRLPGEPRQPPDGYGWVRMESRILTPRGVGEESDLFVLDFEANMVTRASRSILAREVGGQARKPQWLHQRVSHLGGDLPLGTFVLREERDYAADRSLLRRVFVVGQLTGKGHTAHVAWDLGEHLSVASSGWTRVHVIARCGRRHTMIEDCAEATAVLPP